MWCSIGGILKGCRTVRGSEVASGVFTVTGPNVHVTDGFTSDGVVDAGESSTSSTDSWRIPFISNSDEGLGGEGTQEMYVDIFKLGRSVSINIFGSSN